MKSHLLFYTEFQGFLILQLFRLIEIVKLQIETNNLR